MRVGRSMTKHQIFCKTLFNSFLLFRRLSKAYSHLRIHLLCPLVQAQARKARDGVYSETSGKSKKQGEKVTGPRPRRSPQPPLPYHHHHLNDHSQS